MSLAVMRPRSTLAKPSQLTGVHVQRREVALKAARSLTHHPAVNIQRRQTAPNVHTSGGGRAPIAARISVATASGDLASASIPTPTSRNEENECGAQSTPPLGLRLCTSTGGREILARHTEEHFVVVRAAGELRPPPHPYAEEEVLR